MNYKPEYINLKLFLHKVGEIRFPQTWNELCIRQCIIEAYLIPGISGYFISYEDIIKLSYTVSENFRHDPHLLFIHKKFNGIPISKNSLENLQNLIPEVLPTEIIAKASNRYKLFEEVFDNQYEAACLLAYLSFNDETLYDRNSFYIHNIEENYDHFRDVVNEINNALQSKFLNAVYYNIDSNAMEPINQGLWFSEESNILWKHGKAMINGKYRECFITSESSDSFLKALEIRKNISPDTLDVADTIFPNDEEFAKSNITKQNIENIQDSLAFRVFKLALICDSFGYRKTTNETLADFIFNSQDWYFEGTHKTMTLAKKAASMVRGIDAAKGGVAQDLRKYDHRTKKIV